ncbi:hypothetical protein BBJ28_00016248 [Nothophytophthora sp. Chile5]|nr:hypothetical protein BBJ28_00016248 [Nothophytophthora sp. Chile5]
MKFGKRVRSLASPEWEADYVDYKTLKKHIKLLFPSSEEELELRSATIDKRTADFRALLEAEMLKINNAHALILDELANRELKALQEALGTRWVLPQATARTLLLDALQLSSRVDAFRRFVVLNSLALVKISKKFDKAANAGAVTTDSEAEDLTTTPCSRLKAQVLEDLKCQPFYDAASLDVLCDDTAALTDRVMLCVLPDGNFRLGPRALTCPICLCADVQAPITLSCAHTFCWSCLSRAAQHRFRSCPLCRRAQSVDPRDYEIDGLVKRFKRAYEFVEQALDVAPLVASPMRQILAEAFDVGNTYLREVEDQYAALTPLPSAEIEESESKTNRERDDKLEEAKAELLVAIEEEEVEEEPPVVFEKGDIVEVMYGEQWYAGVVLQHNEADGVDDTYSVLWWVKDKSQRFGQRTPRHHLREPLLVPVPAALYEYAADAWRSSGSVGNDSFSRRSSDNEVAIKRILHFSDVHLNISESLDPNDSAKIPFEYGVDAPISLLTSALEYAQQVLPDPDFFLYTGDHAVHGDPSEEYLAEAVKVNVATMTEYFSIVGNESLNITAILGNSDTSTSGIREMVALYLHCDD